MEAYSKVTGDFESQPQSSGGATYSRAINNCVAFGCLLPSQEDTMHQANEYLEIDKLQICLEIMLEAIYQLAK
jgi:succinyl-diaminopimelate desuccinylase